MNAWHWVQMIGIMGPIVAMLVLGFILTLRSGVGQVTTSASLRKVLVNASETIILVAGCLIGLLAINILVGQPLGIIW